MKTILLTLFLLFLSITVTAQQHRTEPQDTTLSLLRTTDPSLLLEKPIFVLPFSLALTTAGNTPHPTLYQSFAGVPQSFAWDRHEMIDLTAPLMLQLKDAEKERPWKITLGAAGTAGALYIAYKHIKKYGFK